MSNKHDASYYSKCLFGGMLACGLTHTAIVPLDVVKCIRQADPTRYKSLGEGLNHIYTTKGVGSAGLALGWAPTFIGYSLQGCFKFGLYEIFKDVYKKLVGDDNAVKYRRTLWSFASGTAEIFADLALCPWEATKVRMQTSKEGTSNFGEVFRSMKEQEGMAGLYKGIGPLWARQVPYTIVKFVAFEQIVETFYKKVFIKPRNEYSKGQQLGVTFLSGYLAGIFCAIVSHPADTMVSKLYNVKTQGSTLDNIKKIYADIGFAGLWRGLGTRIFMIGTLTGLQWWIYDSFKTAVGLQASGGDAVAKKH